MVSLKDIIQKPITGEWGSDGEGIKVIRTTNFTNQGVLNLDKIVSRDVSENKIAQKKLQKGDVIIEKSGGSPTQPVGRVVYFDEDDDYLCNNFTAILRPRTDKVVPKYLHHILFASHKFGITEMFQNKTTGIINLQLPRYIEKIKIPMPNLETQKRIAQILDDAAALRLKTEQILKEYDLLAQSLFFDMFGDPVKNEKGWNTEIGENICKNISVGIVIKPASYYVNDGVIALRSLNIKKNNIDLSNTVHLSKEAHLSVLKKSILKTGDIVVVRTGNTGTAAVIPESLDGVNCIDLIIIRPDINKMNSKFFIYFLNSERGKLLILGKSVGGIQKHFNVGSMKKLILPVPPLALQNQFAEKIALIEKQKELAKQELKESEDLFNCLLQKAFKGELV
jgi:type I restriction enzyme S subunit